MTTQTTLSAAALSTTQPDRLTVLLRVAWLSIVLGLGMQFAAMAAVRLAGGPAAEFGAFLRDLAQKVSWSTLVCVGVALGTTVANVARPVALGIAGFLAAPLAFVAAKTVQKSTAAAVGLAPPEELGAIVFGAVLLLRAVEYASLGAALAWLARRASTPVWSFVAAGLVAGLLFGGAVLGVLYANSDPRMPTPRLISSAVNEFVFPMGCALVLFAAKCLGERLRPPN